MKKILIGILLGLLISMAVKTVQADWERLTFVDSTVALPLGYGVMYDKLENVNCYWVIGGNFSPAISCLKK